MKKRLDQLLVEKGLAESRTKSQAIIMSGKVFVDGKKVDKVGTQVKEDAVIEVEEVFPYVSRGALKLEQAFNEFDINFQDKVVCDIGSSTGGFTDFALQHGAKIVFAIDVGTGQLAQKIREDDRVEVYEKTDFRDFKTDESIEVFVCDVSFISLKKIIPKISELISFYRHPELDSGSIEIPDQVRNGIGEVECILLIKPQFEVGKKEADRGRGVITDPILHEAVINEIKIFATENDFEIAGICESPIKGAKGNIEFLLYLKKSL